MKKYILLSMLCFVCLMTNAQKISYDFRNVSMSKALKLIESSTKEYSINFIYNELEDFSVTTNVRNKSIPDANDIFHHMKYKEEERVGRLSFNQTEYYNEWYYAFTVKFRFNNKSHNYHGKSSAQDEINRLLFVFTATMTLAKTSRKFYHYDDSLQCSNNHRT